MSAIARGVLTSSSRLKRLSSPCETIIGFMEITFLGTAAATSYPLAFCRCEFCIQARKLGGKDFRKRSSIIFNDDLLIDMGPDILSASFMYHKSIAEIRYCLQTH